jgi:adenosylcobinamide amidohydrolase
VTGRRTGATLPPVMPELLRRNESGLDLPYLVWRLPAGARVASSAVLGGGIGQRRWILNAQVRPGYDRLDPAQHLTELAASAGLGPGPHVRGQDGADEAADTGVGLLTAADVDDWRSAVDGGVRVDATVGVRVPTWAAWPEGSPDPDLDRRSDAVAGAGRPGTINIVALVPVGLADAALVNLVATATEAKTQALLDAGVPGTGTATDAVCIVAGLTTATDSEPFGGPRSLWGSRVARAVHASVLAGTRASLARMDVPGAPSASSRADR